MRRAGHLGASLLLCAATLVAQSTLGTLVGNVTDASGGALSGVVVTVLNQNTGSTGKTVTNADGGYIMPQLPAGVYTVTAERPSFKRLTQKDVVLQVAQSLRLDLRLEVGDVNQTVSVAAEAPLVNTENSEVGQVITNRTITELPLNGREFIQLVQLAPGANAGPPGASSGASLNPGGGSVGTNPGTASLNGASDESNGYMLDGVENTDLFQHQAAIRPSIDAIQEFKVQDKLMPAEFGGTSSGVVSAITKSGSNQFHGTLWEFLRNDKLDARSFFDTNKPIRRRNQFGGVFTGPVLIPKLYNGANRTFFMVDYEATRFRSAITQFGTVPTDAMKQGDFSAVVPAGQLYDPFSAAASGARAPFANSIIPQNRWNTTSAKLAGLFPSPNTPGNGAAGRISNNYVKQVRVSQNIDQVLARLDHNFSVNDRLFGRFAWMDDDSPTPGLLPNSDTSVQARARSFVLDWAHVFSPSMFSEVKLGVLRRRPYTAPASLALADFNQQYGFQSREPGVPPIGMTGLSTLGSTAQLFDLPITDYNPSASLSKIAGRHAFKFGFSTDRIGMNNGFADVAGGSRSFSGNFTRQLGAAPNALEGRAFADFLLGTASSIGGLNIDVNADRHRPRFAFYHAYVEDDWKVSPRLTINLGLRYDVFQPPVLTNGRGSAWFDFSTGQLVYPSNAPLPSDCCAWPFRKENSDQQTHTSWNNLGPRFGFAYRIGGGNRTVMRGGYGIYYDPGTLNVAFNNSQSPPFFKSTTITASPDETNPANFLPITLDVAPANTALPLPVTFKSYQENTKTGMMQQWTLGLEHQFTNSLVFGLSYVGWKADHFLVDNPMNFPLPGPGNPQLRRPYQAFGSSVVQMSNSSSNYHGMNAKLEQRLVKGLSFLGAFTWAHVIGNSPSENGNDLWVRLQRYDNLRLERGSQEWDVRLRGVLSLVYEVPAPAALPALARSAVGGWQAGFIFVRQTGWPFTPVVQGDLLNRGSRSTTYANWDGTDPSLPSDQRSPQHWFNTQAFSTPAAYTYGNSGRGVVRTDGINNFDIALSKNFWFMETRRVQFRSEFFNLFNHASFGIPNRLVNNPSFGTVNYTFNYGRQIQFGLKLLF